MWQCSKCGREFKSKKEHFCSETPNTIDAYIEEQPEGLRPRLNLLRDTLCETLPEAEERISWRMPTYWKSKNIIHFASFKNHIGVYPGAEAIEHFAEKLAEYKSSKGAVQFPHSRPLPLELIADIAKWCFERRQ